MSRTDKTRPWRVKVDDHRVLYPRRTEPLYHPDKYWVGELKCGCVTCADPADRKWRTRVARYAGRREAREGQR